MVHVTAGIWHNDIKPENLLLLSSHPDSALKVADFGFARTHEYCSSGEVIHGYGSKGYMAPEVEQLEWHSHQSEMYSAGAVFYFMLCGEDHFQFDDGKSSPAGLSAASPVHSQHALLVCAIAAATTYIVVFCTMHHVQTM